MAFFHFSGMKIGGLVWVGGGVPKHIYNVRSINISGTKNNKEQIMLIILFYTIVLLGIIALKRQIKSFFSTWSFTLKFKII